MPQVGKPLSAKVMEPETPTSEQPTLLGSKRIAAIYSVNNATVLAWFHAGIIPAAVAVGNVIRFDREAVAEAIARHTEKKNRANRNGMRKPSRRP